MLFTKWIGSFICKAFECLTSWQAPLPNKLNWIKKLLSSNSLRKAHLREFILWGSVGLLLVTNCQNLPCDGHLNFTFANFIFNLMRWALSKKMFRGIHWLCLYCRLVAPQKLANVFVWFCKPYFSLSFKLYFSDYKVNIFKKEKTGRASL